MSRVSVMRRVSAASMAVVTIVVMAGLLAAPGVAGASITFTDVSASSP